VRVSDSSVPVELLSLRRKPSLKQSIPPLVVRDENGGA